MFSSKQLFHFHFDVHIIIYLMFVYFLLIKSVCFFLKINVFSCVSFSRWATASNSRNISKPRELVMFKTHLSLCAIIIFPDFLYTKRWFFSFSTFYRKRKTSSLRTQACDTGVFISFLSVLFFKFVSYHAANIITRSRLVRFPSPAAPF